MVSPTSKSKEATPSPPPSACTRSGGRTASITTTARCQGPQKEGLVQEIQQPVHLLHHRPRFRRREDGRQWCHPGQPQRQPGVTSMHKDTVKALPPPEAKVMKKAMGISIPMTCSSDTWSNSYIVWEPFI